jgi:hypothetical protein
LIQAAVMDAIPWISWIPAVIAAAASGGVAVWKSRTDLNALRTQVAFKNEDTLNSMQAKYITPLRSATVTLSRRMGEIEQKFQENKYGEVREWFKAAKDHVVGDKRKDDFQKWCYYEGTFALSTIYYTGVYFRCVHDISAHAPFRQLASRYSSDLERQLERVRDAFDWQNEGKAKGIWAPIQDVLGQRFTSAVDESDAALLSYRDMCELLDSGQPFKYGPFMRLLDVYWETLRLGNVQAIRAELENTLAFIERHPLRDELRQ